MCTIREDRPKLLLQLSTRNFPNLEDFLCKTVFFFPIFFKSLIFLFSNSAGLGVWFMELREKMSWGRNAKGSEDCRLGVVKCMAWVRETQQLLPQSLQMRVVHARKPKKNQTKDKNGCEAVGKEEQRWTDKSRGAHRDYCFLPWANIHLCYCSGRLWSTDETCRKWMDRAMKYDDAGWKGR